MGVGGGVGGGCGAWVGRQSEGLGGGVYFTRNKTETKQDISAFCLYRQRYQCRQEQVVTRSRRPVSLGKACLSARVREDLPASAECQDGVKRGL